jgi:hypothetical protein
MTIDSDMAALVGFVCEAFFYGAVSAADWRGKLIANLSLGFYTVLFALSVYLMFNGPRGGTDVNKPILVISVFLFLCCSTHFALEFSHFYKVLVCATLYQSYAIIDHPLGNHRRQEVRRRDKSTRWR